MEIKRIFDEISDISGDNDKLSRLKSYMSNNTLKRALYLIKSSTVKFHIRQIPEYAFDDSFDHITLYEAMDLLLSLSDRTYTGNQASEWLQSILNSLTTDDAYIIERIIDKDPKIGMGRTQINKVWDKLIEKTPYMGAKSYSEKLAKKILEDDKWGFSQIKADGRYANTIKEDGKLYLEARSGEATVLTGSKVLKELECIPDGMVINGELTIDGIDRSTGNGIITSIINISKRLEEGLSVEKEIAHMLDRHDVTYEEVLEKIRYSVWDIITIEDYDNRKGTIPYDERLTTLEEIIEANHLTQISMIEYKIVHTLQEAMEHFKDVLDRGLEGTILKSSDGIWKDSKPNWQVKMKLVMLMTMEIVECNYGSKGSKNEHVISSVTVKSSDGKVVARAQGIKEKEMKYLEANKEEVKGKMMEMKSNGLSSNRDGGYSVLYPTWEYIRDDKDVADSFEEILEIEEAAKTLS